jgi:hypothetical protein
MSCSSRDVANAGFRVLGGVMLLATVLLFLYSAREVYFARVSRSWPQTRGKIVDNVKIATKYEVPGSRGQGARTVVSYHRHVEYDYLVEGHAYRGTRIAFWEYNDRDCDGVDRLDDEVPVFYDPQVPARSVLFPGLRRSLWPSLALLAIGLGSGATFACCGVRVFEWIGFRRRR